MKKKVASAISLVILILILLYVSGIVAQFMINIKGEPMKLILTLCGITMIRSAILTSPRILSRAAL